MAPGLVLNMSRQSVKACSTRAPTMGAGARTLMEGGGLWHPAEARTAGAHQIRGPCKKELWFELFKTPTMGME